MKKFAKTLTVALSCILIISLLFIFTGCSGDTAHNQKLAEECALEEAERKGRETERDSSSSASFEFESAKVTNTVYSDPNYIVTVTLNIKTTLSYGGSSFSTETSPKIKYTVNVSGGKAKIVNEQILKD